MNQLLLAATARSYVGKKTRKNIVNNETPVCNTAILWSSTFLVILD